MTGPRPKLAALALALAAAAALAAATPARAAGAAPRAELTPIAGAWLPVGEARGDFAAAPLAGLVVSYDLDPRLALEATVAWAGTEADRLASADLDLFEYALGLRGQRVLALGRGATLRPFVGLGVGFRTFRFHDHARYAGGTGFAPYASGGVSLGWRALTAGLTVRHHLFTPNANALDVDGLRQDVEVFTAIGVRF